MTLTENCVHCGLCTGACDFLKKYNLDLATFADKPDLAYHCFLCGECSRVCPENIDGRAVALEMRRAVQETKGYKLLLWEKQNYKFKNYRGARGNVALFPGCNFPSFFPETTNKLAALLKEKANIGVIYDCCGKPVSELGLDTGIKELESRLKSKGIEELVMLCPNCYYFLKGKIDVKITDIYAKLRELGLGENIITEQTANIFVPCPDRATGEIAKSMADFFESEQDEKIKIIEGVQCCGMGGCTAAKEPELAVNFREKIKGMNLPNVYTYCATCAGALNRQGVKNIHVLTKILRTDEVPEMSCRSIWNRAKKRFWE